MIKITLVKSASNETKTVKATVTDLGLRKIVSTKILEDTPANMGQIKKISYLLKVEKAGE